MLSGPDLGGGLLHQLTVEGATDQSRFTFHAQAGGADASGPPLGSPEPIGYLPFRAMCALGGTQCWHRTFELPRSSALKARTAYNRMRFTMEAMLRQLYAKAPVPVESTLEDALRRIAGPLEQEKIGFAIAGRASGWLAGRAGPPPEIELVTTPTGVGRIGELLAEYLIEPIAPTEWPTGRQSLAGRAFLGTLIEGARIEWRSGDLGLRTQPVAWRDFRVATTETGDAAKVRGPPD